MLWGKGKGKRGRREGKGKEGGEKEEVEEDPLYTGSRDATK